VRISSTVIALPLLSVLSACEVSVGRSGTALMLNSPNDSTSLLCSEAMVGMVVSFLGQPGELPSGWCPCDGRILSKAEHPALHDLISAAFAQGGEGEDQFRLPDLNHFCVPIRSDEVITEGQLFLSSAIQDHKPVFLGDQGQVGSSWSRPCAAAWLAASLRRLRSWRLERWAAESPVVPVRVIAELIACASSSSPHSWTLSSSPPPLPRLHPPSEFRGVGLSVQQSVGVRWVDGVGLAPDPVQVEFAA
jgi:microcystin-dependent protein